VRRAGHQPHRLSGLISLIPFQVVRLRMRGLPAVPATRLPASGLLSTAARFMNGHF
jgi:hypothetical protein